MKTKRLHTNRQRTLGQRQHLTRETSFMFSEFSTATLTTSANESVSIVCSLFLLYILLSNP